ncbi:MAG: phosphate ABC transporter permease subunit PstC [Deltaproteobacteria bacterium]|nr:phosphate ABC transporter permease subunit PstC [Deltaproteobacteria bacterium]
MRSVPPARRGDRAFRLLAAGSAGTVLLLMAGLFVALGAGAWPAVRRFGVGFVVSNTWNPVTERFGALSSIYGTLVSTLLALLIAVPLSVIIALFLVELAHPTVARVVGGAIELLAAVPSIIFGMWGLFVFAPYMADHVQPALSKTLGFLPLFTGPPLGIGMLSAGVILALMILPFVTAVMRDVFRMVPAVVKEAAYGMGSTTWEVTRGVTVRYGAAGMIGAVFLGLGRAVGETMAVTFVIGNDHAVSASLFAAGNSIASTLANEFTEAAEPLYRSCLVYLGLVLLVLTVAIQAAAQLWLRRILRRMGRSG